MTTPSDRTASRPDDPASAERALAARLRAAPRDPLAWRQLGDVLWSLGRLDESESAYRSSIKISRYDPITLANFALVLSDLGRIDEALTEFERSLRIDPTNRQARHNRSLALLLRGDYERGWIEYESRWGSESLPFRPFPRPLWDGSPLDGRTILLHAEQGLGDTLQVLRYVPLVKARGGRVVLVVQPALRKLLEGADGVDLLTSQSDPIPPFDLHAPLFSLPRIFGTTLETIPARVPYLRAEPARVDRWRGELDRIGGFRIGITWQGNPKYRRDRERSIPLGAFAPLAALPGVTLIGLQVGPGREQIAANREKVPLVDLADRIDLDGPFLDTAALLTSLDLVISPDTVLAHLAGALGVPTWVALPVSPHWVWLLDRPDSPWYPTARLFRQPTRGDWTSVFGTITDTLAALPPGPIRIEIAPGELFDKISILRIKAEKISDPNKLRNIREELSDLEKARDRSLRIPSDLVATLADLHAVNLAIWEVEDGLRRLEREGLFADEFVTLARAVYQNNDRRARLKRHLNERFRSRLIEEKSYNTGTSARESDTP